MGGKFTTTKTGKWSKILDAEYKPASLDDVIKTFENLHVEEQHQLINSRCYSKNMNICFMEH
jgi:hypothetical protein